MYILLMLANPLLAGFDRERRFCNPTLPFFVFFSHGHPYVWYPASSYSPLDEIKGFFVIV
jgi:hypothetical protein